ncbi:MAG TPA: tRNA pseudouridine(55) synthase TruB, partial [Xanthomonadales bacterium]|nr:tRNA pseudouridine(55) synthase TruB [Xanthomonadales bacterium]
MGASRKGRDVHAVFLLDKPAGLSSNQALQQVRRLLNARKAGHTGTLDPFATGLLPICLGEASKTAGLIMDGRKSYTATLQLGSATATGDTEGEVVDRQPVPTIDLPAIEAAMQNFRGPLNQVPPMFSAIKQDGKPLYELARQGIEVERKARAVEIFRLETVCWNSPVLEFSVICSKGTYIRTLAEELARALGSCGHLQALRRTGAEPFNDCAMYTLDDLANAVQQNQSAELLLPADAGLPDWPLVVLQGDQVSRFMHGNSVVCTAPESRVRVHGKSASGESNILGL